MKLLYLTDTHFRGTSPRSRTDDFPETMRNKLSEVVAIANSEQVDAILHGGDLFDRPNLSPAVVQEYARILRQFSVPIYAIAGNHDIYGHNPATIDRTMLGLLDAFGVIRLIRDHEKIRLEKDGVSVQLSGCSFHYDLDKRERKLDYTVKNEVGADYCIHMVHGMLVHRALPDGIPHTMVHEVWSDDVDILLTGHYHAGFPMQEKNGKVILNPGALARVNNQSSEINRMPQVVLIELNQQIQIRFVPLTCAKPGEEVLDRTYIEKVAYRQEKLKAFEQQIRSLVDFEEMDVIKIIDQISNERGIDEQVRIEARSRIEKVQVIEGENEIEAV